MAEVPIIDLACLANGSPDARKAVVDQLMRAATEIGFLQVVNHGIPARLVDEMFKQSAEFFSLPLDVKQKCRHEASKNIGFESFSQIRPSTGLPDNKESLQLGFYGMEGKFPATADCPAFEATAKEFQLRCLHLALELLSCFAVGLGFPADFFNERVGQGGLEVCSGRTAVTDYGVGDQWTPVEPCENAVTVNIGDLLMRWSDDKLKSNFHRVRMPPAEEASKPRYSIAFFSQPNRSSLVQGLQKKYPPITAGEYVLQAMRPQFEAKKLWAEALEDAKKTGGQPGPVKVVTAQAATVA